MRQRTELLRNCVRDYTVGNVVRALGVAGDIPCRFRVLSEMGMFRKSSIQLPVAVLVNALEICAAVLGQGRQTL